MDNFFTSFLNQRLNDEIVEILQIEIDEMLCMSRQRTQLLGSSTKDALSKSIGGLS